MKLSLVLLLFAFLLFISINGMCVTRNKLLIENRYKNSSKEISFLVYKEKKSYQLHYLETGKPAAIKQISKKQYDVLKMRSLSCYVTFLKSKYKKCKKIWKGSVFVHELASFHICKDDNKNLAELRRILNKVKKLVRR